MQSKLLTDIENTLRDKKVDYKHYIITKRHFKSQLKEMQRVLGDIDNKSLVESSELREKVLTLIRSNIELDKKYTELKKDLEVELFILKRLNTSLRNNINSNQIRPFFERKKKYEFDIIIQGNIFIIEEEQFGISGLIRHIKGVIR